jgi:thioredoxin-dependent peroxiredoxin
LIMIAMGTSDVFPLASNRRIPTARGPGSLITACLRSPVTISGRFSCAVASAATRNDTTNPVVNRTRGQTPRYTIFRERTRPEAATAPAKSPEFIRETPMNINDKAPEFTLQDENGKEIALKHLRGKTVVLYFYPRADTPGCTVEACEFRDTYRKIQKTGAVLLGISPDTPKDQKKFVDKFSLPFTLLADADKKVATAFGVMKEKNMYGKKVWGVARTTFVIGPDGRIQHIFEKVRPEGHAEQVLDYLKESAKGAA